MNVQHVEDIYALSPMQQGMLFHTLYAPEEATYSIQFGYTLQGTLDVAAFAEAWQQMIERHAVLRTSFFWEDIEKPLQIVHRRMELPWQQLDWRGLAQEEQQARMAAFLEADRARGFDLLQLPLMRLTLIRLAEHAWQLILSSHHLLLDGWSAALLFQSFFVAYEALSRRQPPPAQRSRPYRDYILWLQQQDLARAERFWREQLKGFSSQTPLIAGHVDPASGRQPGASERQIQLPSATTAALRSLARTHQLTASTLIQGVWALLLSRYSGEDDVVFGITVAGRPPALDGVETMIGLFINTLPLRVRLIHEQPLLAWLQELQARSFEIQQFEYTPLVEIQGWSEVPRNPDARRGAAQLFESLLVFENYPVDPELSERRERLRIQRTHSVEQTNYPLTVVASLAEELTLRILYDSRRFDAVTVDRILGHFRTALEAIVANPRGRLLDVPLLTVAEWQQLLVEWNDTHRSASHLPSVAALVQAQVERTPDAIALTFHEEQLSYRALHSQAHHLALALRARGVGVDVPVALCVERSVEMLVALLGILYAGGAYLPLDPAYPPERLAFMLKDSRAPLLLTQPHLRSLFPDTAAQVLCLEPFSSLPACEQPAPLPAFVSSESLVYVIYTSGSTGQPKGVELTQRALTNLLAWQLERSSCGVGARTMQFTSLSFDVAFQEVFASWAAGGTLVLVEDERRRDPHALALLLREQAVERLFVPFVALQQLAEAVVESGVVLERLREVVTAGEQLRVTPALRRMFGALPQARLENQYGPSESHVVTAERLEGEPSEWAELPSIGRPIANSQIYLLDGRLEPVPVGVLGELYIGGVGLARGYLGRPELTAERLVPNPFLQGRLEIGDLRLGASQSPISNRLYRTGDRARYLPDGRIEFVGRVDGQVKLRGYRVELGEVEAVLAQHPSVREVAVLVRNPDVGRGEDVAGQQRLVAYLVTDQEQRTKPVLSEVEGNKEQRGEKPASQFSILNSQFSELRDYLKTRLPEYMVPSAFVMLEALPLTPSGKLDRRALPMVEASGWELGGAEPRTPEEQVLAGIWGEVLGVERVGREANFFELGGHSLLATQVVSRIRSVFGVELELRKLFEQPTVAGLAGEVLGRRREGLARLRPVERVGGLPLSFAQQRLWFLNQFEPHSSFYNIPAIVRLSGSLDVAALERSLAALLDRHETLRTHFGSIDDQPVQFIAPAVPLALPLHDLQHLDPLEREAEAQRLAWAEAHQPFGLESGPLLRVQVLRLAVHEYILLLTMHHIVADGWSIGVLIRDLAALYQAQLAGRAADLPGLPIQYADYAVWQRDWLQGAVLEQQLAYWKDHLAELPTLALPTDRPRPPTQSFRGASLPFLLNSELSAALGHLSRQSSATLYMTLLAAFQVLLSRYSGQADIVVGSPIANRTRAETEDLIGFFVNTLVLRSDLSGDPSFRSLLTRVREGCLAAYTHQDLPFEMLVDALQPQRDLSRNPLFQVLFALQNAPLPALELPGLSLQSLPTVNQATRFDLEIHMMEQDDGIAGGIVYSTDLFDAATIGRLLGHFEMLLAGITADPEQPLSHLPLLTAAERQQLLVEWNDTHRSASHPPSVAALVQAQVERTPDAIALTFHEEQLSYRALHSQAHQLALALRARGVGVDVPVGLCVERSLDMLVALLGILYAGGAYLPLDPAYPPERLAFMLKDSRAPLLLTQPHLRSLFPDSASEVLCLERSSLLPAHEQFAPLPALASPESLVYVIYTSGSTGQPKGVELTQRALTNLLAWQLERSSCGVGARTMQFTSLSFDVAFQEVFASWAAGGTLVLVEDERRRDPHALALLLREQAVERLFVPFVALQQLAEAVVESGVVLERLREVVTAGEQLRVTPALRRMFGALPQARLENQYGPSESHVVTAERLEGAVSEWAELPSIGRPIANSQIYLLDGRLEPVPVGVLGELYIGGVGLARGYLGRPDLTAERLVPNPFLQGRLEIGDLRLGASQSPISSLQSPISNRLYRTGDRARYLPDGRIEFVGRVDGQVKLRGYRVELGEVEAVLAQHPSVREVAVLVRNPDVGRGEDVAGQQRLVAYLVTDQEQRTKPVLSEVEGNKEQRGEKPASQFSILNSQFSELRDYLKTRLPEYMVPSAFVLLEALPLTPSGKLDRRALPMVEASGWELGGAEPRTPEEQVLAGIWGEVLGVERVGREANFFELGGHSLLATQVVSRIRSVFGVELELRKLFEQPTVAGLAGEVLGRRREGLARLRPVERVGGLPLSFAQQRLWFLDQLVPNNPFYNLPAALHLTGSIDVAALERSLATLLDRHETLRTSFTSVDGMPVQVIAPALPLVLPLHDLQHLSPVEQEEEVRQRVAAEGHQPFGLESGPLLRVQVLRLAALQHILLLTMHHIVTDEWSIGVLIRDLAALYQAQLAGQAADLPGLPIQYADYAVWQRDWLQGAVLEQQLAYWKDHLAELPTLALPTDRPRPPTQSFRGASLPFLLNSELSAALGHLSRQSSATLYMTLLAAFQVLLSRYSGQADIVVGSPIANRTRAETEDLIGFFVNTLVLRSDLSGDPSFRTLLGRVREGCLAAYTHQDLPFEMLVDALQPQRDLSRNPLFQVLFALQNAPLPALELPGLSLQSVPATNEATRFDLEVHMMEQADGIIGSIVYSTDLFDAATIRRLLGHFQVLLAGITADPEQLLSHLPLLTEAERQQLLVEWNDTAVERAEALFVHQLVEAQAARTPDSVAVAFGEEHLSYALLNARANQLAHALRAHGVGPDVRVALCVERSLEMMIGLLGILKAGGAYVPLDPSYPPERLAFMLAEAEVALLVTQATQTIQRLIPATPVIRLDADWMEIAGQCSENLVAEMAAEQLGYVIYTSGSTGRPKGVALSQRALTNLLAWQTVSSTPDCRARVLQFASVNFDVSFQEIFSTWCSGGTLLLIDEATRHDAFELLRTLRREGPERLFLPFVALQSLAEVAVQERDFPTSLKDVITAGEQLRVTAPIRQFFKALGRCRLHNHYGPSETHVVTAYLLDGCPDDWPALPPIGRAIANTQLYLLDAQLQPVPIGVHGELYIGGHNLARGYLNRPDLTAERFVPTPFTENKEQRTKNKEPRTENRELLPPAVGGQWSVVGGRLYRTGDLARYLPDGNIEFLGRVDHQVKIRGFRVEPGEIEAALGRHPAVREAAVVVRVSTAGEKRLVAYLVPGQEQRTKPVLSEVEGNKEQKSETPDSQFSILNSQFSGELRAFLKEHLPEYMIPAAFVFLEALPVSPNGKVDRRALPDPAYDPSNQPDTFVEPQTAFERTLASIWQGVLGVPRVGVHDNFFSLGGDSLLSVRIVARAKQAGLAITVPHMMHHQTIAELVAATGADGALSVSSEQPDAPAAGAMAEIQRSEERAAIARQEQGIITGPVPRVPRVITVFKDMAIDLHNYSWNSVVLLEVAQPLDFTCLQEAVRQLLLHHDALRLRYVQNDADWQQFIAAPNDTIPCHKRDLSPIAPEAQRPALEAAVAEFRASLNLADGPLCRFVLFDLGAGQPQRLLVIVHHLANDQYSFSILLDDLYTAYTQLSRSEPVRLTPKTTSVKRWAEAVAAYAASDAIRHELDYWLALPWEHVRPLPVDYPERRGTDTEATSAVVNVSLDVAETQALLRALPKGGNLQVTHVLLAALGEAFKRWTGDRTLLLETIHHGRSPLFEDIDLSRTVGWCTVHTQMLLDLRQVEAPREVLQSVAAQVQAIPTVGMGYELLRYFSQDEALSQPFREHPRADVMVNYYPESMRRDSPALGAFRPAKESVEAGRNRKNIRYKLLEVVAMIVEGRLVASWSYSTQLYRQATIEALAGSFIEAMHTFIRDLSSSNDED